MPAGPVDHPVNSSEEKQKQQKPCILVFLVFISFATLFPRYPAALSQASTLIPLAPCHLATMHIIQLSVLALASAQMGSLFEQILQQQRQQQQQEEQKLGANPVERVYHELKCEGFLCQDSLTCVENAIDCPCPFPSSQIKCNYPDNSAFVCLSKPASDDGVSCDFVNDAFNGKI